MTFSRRIASALTLPLTLFALSVQAQTGNQSFESCSLITSEYLTVLQLKSRGFEEDTLQSALPEVSPQASARIQSLYSLVEESGLETAYSMINSEYGQCARSVYSENGLPSRGSREGHFYFCAGENKVRYEILLAAIVGAPPAQVRSQLAPQHQPVVEPLYTLFQQGGSIPVFDSLSSELKHCINSRQ